MRKGTDVALPHDAWQRSGPAPDVMGARARRAAARTCTGQAAAPYHDPRQRLAIWEACGLGSCLQQELSWPLSRLPLGPHARRYAGRTQVLLGDGRPYEEHAAWTDMYNSMMAAERFIFITGWSVWTGTMLTRNPQSKVRCSRKGGGRALQSGRGSASTARRELGPAASRRRRGAPFLRGWSV